MQSQQSKVNNYGVVNKDLKDSDDVVKTLQSSCRTRVAQAHTNSERQAPMQMKTQQSNSIPNNTGLPDNLKSGIEGISGYSMDDVKVHYNSNKPAQLNAHAYAQGTDIHLGSGQEKHLPHEAWHVVQQKQGRVQATRQMKAGVNINDDTGLEKEADVMGARALQLSTPLFLGLKSSFQNPIENAITVQGKMKSDSSALTWTNTQDFKEEKFSKIPNPHVGMSKMANTNSPGKIEGMDDAQTSEIIKDPSRNNQRLTRMHMIRAKFGGPGDSDNLKLGTASSNNGGKGSHTQEVEYPIEKFITDTSGEGNKRGVSYSVTVGNQSVPNYLVSKAKEPKYIANIKDINDFLVKWCPTSFNCSATFYSWWPDSSNKKWSWWKSEEQVEEVRLDIGS